MGFPIAGEVLRDALEAVLEIFELGLAGFARGDAVDGLLELVLFVLIEFDDFGGIDFAEEKFGVFRGEIGEKFLVVVCSVVDNSLARFGDGHEAGKGGNIFGGADFDLDTELLSFFDAAFGGFVELLLDGVPIRGEVDAEGVAGLVGFEILGVSLVAEAEVGEILEHLVAIIGELDGFTLGISGGFDEIGVDFEENGVVLAAKIRDRLGHGGEEVLVGEINDEAAWSIEITEAEGEMLLE